MKLMTYDAHIDDGGQRVSPTLDTTVAVSYQPILDVTRGVAAGFQAQGSLHRRPGARDRLGSPPELEAGFAADVVRAALDAFPTLPANTFVSIPLGADVAATPVVRAALAQRMDLAGVVLEIVGFSASLPSGELELALAAYRERGALICVGGHGAAQPELTSIVRLKPAIIRLGRDWTRGIDRSEAKRSAIEVTGRLAGQLDAWVLAEGVSTSAELRSLAGLDVPLAQGPFIGEAQVYWPEIELTARTVLPRAAATSDRLCCAVCCSRPTPRPTPRRRRPSCRRRAGSTCSSSSTTTAVRRRCSSTPAAVPGGRRRCWPSTSTPRCPTP